MASNMMDTEAGGEERNQYESVNTANQSHTKQSGKLGGINSESNEAQAVAEQENKERGEQKAENIRYGQTISEQGFGGETTGHDGVANQRDFGSQAAQEDEQDPGTSRMQQGYGGKGNVHEPSIGA